MLDWLLPLVADLCGAASVPNGGWALLRSASDLLIGLSYATIPVAMTCVLFRRRDVTFSWLVWCFVLFILLCGLGHWMHLYVAYDPSPAAHALVNAATALVSILTAAAIVTLIPALIALPSPTMLHAESEARLRAETQLREALEQRSSRTQDLLVQELNHRVKNTLATVQALALLSLKRVADEHAGDLAAFQQRLIALSQAHDLLNAQAWDGADLREILEKALAPYLTSSSTLIAGPSVELDGDRVRLTANQTVALALLFHELVTNAVKYGSLNPERPGHLRVAWHATDGRLDFAWRCRLRDNAPRLAPPGRQGFGLRLIRQVIQAELAGEHELAFTPSGLHLSFRAALAAPIMSDVGAKSCPPQPLVVRDAPVDLRAAGFAA